MKRLLAVSWELPPMYGPRGTQVWRSLNALGERGWRSTVVSMAPRRGGPHWRDGVDAAPPAASEVVRVASPEESLLVRVASRVAPPLRRLPDPQRVWVGRATRAALRAAAATSFDGLVTFAQPWSDHLVGLRAHKAARLPWVAHFSDPWVDSPYAGATWQPDRARRMEADVIREASGIVFVTAETADLVMRKYPAAMRDKVSIVPHGFEASRTPAPSPRRPGPLRLVHTGRFYEGVRTPSALLQAVARLNERAPLTGVLDLTFVGPFNHEYAAEAAGLGVGTLVAFRDRVSRADADALAADADVLLVIDAPVSGGASVFLPSKLIDYLPMRKPILGLTPEPGAAASLLRRLGGAVVPPGDVDAIAAAIAQLLTQSAGGTLAVGPAFDDVAREYDIRATTAALAAVLEKAFRRAS
jgi:glycosyltransferase involved in cell wall biosynthesis